MKKEKMAKLFLEELAKLPNVQFTCEKIGVSRNTVYRWRKEDSVFSENMDQAITEGIAFVNDMAEGQLLNLIKNKEFTAIRFWLAHRHSAYRTKSEVIIKKEDDELSDEQKQIVAGALKNVGLLEIDNET